MSDEKKTSALEALGGPNPELYERLSKPFDSKKDADGVLAAFLSEVKKLRETYLIPEVVIIAAAFFEPAEGEQTTACVALALGSPEYRAQLGALAFQQYTAPEIERGERLRKMAEGTLATPHKSRKR